MWFVLYIPVLGNFLPQLYSLTIQFCLFPSFIEFSFYIWVLFHISMRQFEKLCLYSVKKFELMFSFVFLCSQDKTDQ